MAQQHEQFMREALAEAKTALAAAEFPVGCLLVKDGRILARGHRQNSSGSRANELDHAEVTTLRRLLSKQPDLDLEGVTVYATMEPCLMCYATLLLSGIRTFVWAYEDIMGGGTGLDLAGLPQLYREMRVEIIPNILRQESLALFQDFFRQYDYWQGSSLAEYTLAVSPTPAKP